MILEGLSNHFTLNSLENFNFAVNKLTRNNFQYSKLENEIGIDNIIKEILLSQKVRDTFINQIPSLAAIYDSEIEKVLPRIYITSFKTRMTGITTSFRNIFINSAPIYFSRKEERAGFYSVIYLHELAHYFLRIECKNVREYLEYRSDSSAFHSEEDSSLQAALVPGVISNEVSNPVGNESDSDAEISLEESF